MPSKKNLGIFFGKNSLSVVETEDQYPTKFFTADYNLFENPTGSGTAKSTPDEIKLTAILQKTLREQKITSVEVGLSLPSKDVIFRSFLIPWMTPGEIKAVVDFESRKYVPFKLSELSYIYHPVTITDKNTKLIRILFTAIKNDILKNYCTILVNSGLRVKSIEPAPISLIRVLTFKKLIPNDQRIAIVQADEIEGKIIIIEQGIPQFIRDFQLIPLANESDKSIENRDPINIRLFNEVKISLEYYGRHNTQDKINGIITLSESENKTNELSESVGKELGIPVTTLNAKSILNIQSVNTIDILNAHGIGLRNTVPLAVSFDLERRAEGKTPQEATTQGTGAMNYRSLGKVAVICVVLIAMTFGLSNLPVEQQKRKLQSLKQQAGVFQDLSEQGIEKKYQEIIKKEEICKNVPLESNAAFFLNMIPRFLPQGIWFKEVTINFSSEDVGPSAKNQIPEKFAKSGGMIPFSQQSSQPRKVTINLSGYAFLENVNQQLRLVKNLVANIKSNKEFMSFFKNVNFTTDTTELEHYTVTYFKINCE